MIKNYKFTGYVSVEGDLPTDLEVLKDYMDLNLIIDLEGKLSEGADVRGVELNWETLEESEGEEEKVEEVGEE